MRILIVLSSVLAVALCAGEWSYLNDPNDQEVCTKLMDLQTATNMVSFANANGNGCPTLISVQEQLVAGMNYRYIFKQGDKVCMLQYYEVPWMNTVEVTGDNCSLATAPAPTVDVKLINRQLAGGYSDQDASSQEFTELLLNMTSSNLLTSAQPYTIQSVQTQVVSGINYKYTLVNHAGKTCVLVIYVQSWTNTQQVKSDDCHLAKTHKRQLLGGIETVTDANNDAGLNECVATGLDKINQQSNSMFRMVESDVSVTKQVVQGISYHITISAAQSGCIKSADTDGYTAADCAVDADSTMTPTKWTFGCWYRSWMSDPDRLQIENLEIVQ